AIWARGFLPRRRRITQAVVTTSQRARKTTIVRPRNRKKKSSTLNSTGTTNAMAKVFAMSLKCLFERERFSAFSRKVIIRSLSDIECREDYHIRRNDRELAAEFWFGVSASDDSSPLLARRGARRAGWWIKICASRDES